MTLGRTVECAHCGRLGHNARGCIYPGVTPARPVSWYRWHEKRKEQRRAKLDTWHNRWYRREPFTRGVIATGESRTPGGYECHYCYKRGHNVRGCPKRKADRETGKTRR